jgi:hypothetical protein
MPASTTASEVLNREFLAVRAGLMDLAAALDRIGRADGSVADDPRWRTIRQALQVLSGDALDRTELLQLLFSLPYQDNWQQE